MIGAAPDNAGQHYFAPPTLETAVVARDPRDKARLHAALTQLAEQDPLIDVRQDEIRQEIYVSLYGEVQKQVIDATLAADYGLAADFRETTPICVERPAGTGTAEEILHAPGNPFLATLGFRIAPAPAGSGIRFGLEVGHQAVPLFVYKNMESFAAAMEQYVTGTLRQGLHGWQVTDATVSLIHGRAEAGRDRGLRADPPFPAGSSGRYAQCPAAGPGQAARHPRGIGHQRLLVHPGR